jgi:hypothetical protein
LLNVSTALGHLQVPVRHVKMAKLYFHCNYDVLLPKLQYFTVSTVVINLSTLHFLEHPSLCCLALPASCGFSLCSLYRCSCGVIILLYCVIFLRGSLRCRCGVIVLLFCVLFICNSCRVRCDIIVLLLPVPLLCNGSILLD